MNSNRSVARFRRVELLVAVAAVLIFAGYLYNLTGWLIYDDEGEYLYQVWRMTLGEVPYRDFLTPQLPVFLYAGRSVMALFGNSLFVMRLYSVLLAFGSATLLYLAGRRRNVLTGFLAFSLFLLHSDVFREMRIFRNEPVFIFLVTAGVVVATCSGEWPRRRQLAAAGVLFGLATNAKLFGLLPAGGIGLWLLWAAWRRNRGLKPLLFDLLALGVPLLLVLALIAAIFTAVEPAFFDLVLGHHLAQGDELVADEVVESKLGLYATYFSLYPTLVALSIGSALLGFLNRDERRRWAWQLPTALAFLVLSRQLGQRHFMYLLPAITLLSAWLISDGLGGRYRGWGRALGILGIVAIALPALQANIYRAGWVDEATPRLVSLIEAETSPGATILADDIGLAYYARRPTTYAGAALSHGAITSGQITGEQLIEEIVHTNAEMVLVDVSLLTGNHMVYLRDYPRFHRFLERNFRLLGNIRRDYQEIDVWERQPGTPLLVEDEVTVEYPAGTRFGETMYLQGYTLPDETVAPGETVPFTLYWAAEAPANNYWSVFAHLLGPDGELVGQQDKVPYGGVYPPNRWWPGQIVDDDYAIALPADARPGTYRLVVGMYDWQTGERLPLYNEEGEPLPNNQVMLAQTVEVSAP